ncbi:MAG TPA: biopolymer transporter ExbD [Catalimonadaceae bacterium]|jgi:biopolymer transport protein ExbD|nr:biopolymer transporter ExbD [Catalimonadaceae bacterium]HPI11591.1 biopolymer transporter ExbD [Catalimonadaceae bacterium]
MNLRRRTKETAEVSTESLNDIMFFLLLFFLIVSTLVNPNVIKLFLPNAKQSPQMAKQPITLSVTAAKEYYINKVPVGFDNLESTLKTELSKLAEPTVVLRLDKSLTIQDLADVMSVGEHLKVKMVLASENSKK